MSDEKTSKQSVPPTQIDVSNVIVDPLIPVTVGDVFVQFRGREPTPDALLRHNGLF